MNVREAENDCHLCSNGNCWPSGPNPPLVIIGRPKRRLHGSLAKSLSTNFEGVLVWHAVSQVPRMLVTWAIAVHRPMVEYYTFLLYVQY